MICFMPGFVTEAERADLIVHDKEQDRLRALFPHDETKVDEGLVEWKKSHPVPPPGAIADVVDHIEHVRRIAGIDHLGLGSDFDGFHGGIRALDDVSCYPALLGVLLDRGFSKKDLEKIAGRNIIRVLRQAETVAVQI